MNMGISFAGPMPYRVRSLNQLCRSVAKVSARRMFHGSRRPGWNWVVEVGTDFLKEQLINVFRTMDVETAREYLDSVVISSRKCPEVQFTNVVQDTFRGTWIAKKGTRPDVSVLYLHGGGYSFYPRAYSYFVALITLATDTNTFVLNYRLAPEHCFPAQLEDGVNAYRWLLDSGIKPENLVVMGDSAGANLAVALLLTARQSGMSLPALAVLLSPPADFERDYPSMESNAEFDWIDKGMAMQWADWFCGAAERGAPLISPLRADLRGLPPIYIQAGRCEIFYDSIEAFAAKAREQGADVVLESWDDMNHVFQIFGGGAPQSMEALRRIGEMIESRVRRQNNKKGVFS